MEFKKRELLTAFLEDKKYSQNLKSKILEDMGRVEECLNLGAKETSLIIVESENEVKSVLRGKNIQGQIPEIDEVVKTSTESWRKRVFIVDDAGDGVVLYRICAGGEIGQNGGKNGA